MRAGIHRLSRPARGLISLAVIVAVIALASVSAAAFTARSPFCASCHEMEAYYDSWQQSSHAEVACVECHLPKGISAYLKEKASSLREVYTHFNGDVRAPLGATREIPQENCVRCHESLPAEVKDNTLFDHSRHDAPCLECHARLVHRTLGSPEYVDPNSMDVCLSCHDGTTADDTCATCHTAPHPRLDPETSGEECETCHLEGSWTPTSFEHPVDLEGAHAGGDCIACHGERSEADGSRSLGEAPTDCALCHQPPHPGMGTCEECHTPEGWLPSTFTHPIELVGNHGEAGCGQCHVQATGSDGLPVLGDAPNQCLACHEAPHPGMGPCEECHTPEGWSPSTFQHPYPLVGAHTSVACTRCHRVSGGDLVEASPACSSCHQPPHYGMGECDRCHSPSGWAPPSFKHPFALTGRHASLSCERCHRITNGNLAKASPSCSSCHRSPHGGPSYCSRCHSTSAWSPQSFRHRQIGEHVPSGENRISCSRCHPTGFASTSCTPCHSGGGGGGGDDD